MSDVFISYSSDDLEQARMLADVLEQRGVSVWWDRKIPPGRTYDDVIEEALHGAKCVVVLWSAKSVTSDWVKTEAAEAAQKDALVPARIEDVDLPLEFRRLQAADLIGWQGDTDAPGLQNLVNAIEGILAREVEEVSDGEPPTPVSAAKPPPPPPPRPEPAVGKGNNGPFPDNWQIWVGGVVAAAVSIIIVLALVLSGGGDESSVGSPTGTVPGGGGSEAEAELARLVGIIDPLYAPVTRGAAVPPPGPPPLPPIEDFRLTVDVPPSAGIVVEIFVSTEKSGDGTDGYLVELAQAFNAADIRLDDGQPAKVAIREIASGQGFQFIAEGEEVPDAYSPSVSIWIEMAKASGVTMTSIREQLVPNVAGLVVKTEIADELEADGFPLEVDGQLSVQTLIDAVIRDDLVMAYTNPFKASTGMNFLVTALLELSGGQPDVWSQDVADEFRTFSAHAETFATALQIRDKIERGLELDAFVMEYQTFVKTDFLSDGWEFIAYGVPHDNPLYAVGELSQDKLDVLELFAEYSERPEWGVLAIEYGFDPDPYTSSVSTPSGQALIDAQRVWKENKSGGRQITAVIVSDVSGSMRGPRIETLRDALNGGISFINDETYVGMVTFSDEVTHVLDITQFDDQQKGLFAAAVEDMRAEGQTAMYDAIAVGLLLLVEELQENPNVEPLLIVLTDGETNEGLPFDDLSGVISELETCIPVHTIGFEAEIGELRLVSDLCEAASYTADVDDLEFLIAQILNGEL